MGAARAIALVAEVSDDAHVAEAVPTRRQECVLYRLHANRAEEILVHLRRSGGHRRRGGLPGKRILRRRRGAGDGRRCPRFRLHRRDQSPARTLVHRNSSLFLSLSLSVILWCEFVWEGESVPRERGREVKERKEFESGTQGGCYEDENSPRDVVVFCLLRRLGPLVFPMAERCVLILKLSLRKM